MSLLGCLAAFSLLIWIYLAFAHGRFWCADQFLEGGNADPAVWPEVVAIVPARNEAAVIERSLDSLLRQDYPGKFSVILVDDESTDDTAAIARQCAATAGGEVAMTVLATPARPAGWVGKMWALGTGVGAASEQLPADGSGWYLLTDADIQHSPGNLRRLVASGESRQLSLVSLMVRLEAEHGWGRLLIPAFVYFFQKLYPFPRVNDPGSSVAAAAGGCMLVRRASLQAAGGVAPLRAEIIDDCAFGRALKQQGPVWLGLTRSVRSIRPYVGLREVWDMVARSAFTQLDYSWVQLAGTLMGLALLYLVPVAAVLAGVLSGEAPAALAGLAAWLLLAATFVPTLVLYGRSPWLSLALPLAGTLYAAMTFDSAWRHAQGRGAYWKGRQGAGSEH